MNIEKSLGGEISAEKNGSMTLAMILTMATIIGCGQGAKDRKETENEPITAVQTTKVEQNNRIAVVVNGNTSGWFIRMQKGIEKWSNVCNAITV